MVYRLGELIPLETYALSVPKTHRYNAFMRQTTLHSIIADLQQIRESNDGNWITTDDLGSGYDRRYKDVSWMDTR